MILGLDGILTGDELGAIRARLAAGAFQDGKATAGWHARLVKENEQLGRDDPAAEAIRAEIDAALRRNAIFAAAVQPRLIQLLVNRYGVGQSYGRHVDDAFMNGRRTDVSLTVFLSDPADYDGGELIIETPAGEQSVKLPAGAAIVYPATTLHRVEPVTRGVRYACAGWVESRVRDPGAREILFDLERARRAMFQNHGKTAEFDLVSKATANLLRRWGE
ncbi:MAG: Fe2+-dependent dioxygenase [Alphaproteobacteria bacterium]|nr:Fe2+-dependent dioxygenase [Alphaproteobacteria bacterium]